MLQLVKLIKVCGRPRITIDRFYRCSNSVFNKDNACLNRTYLLYELPYVRVAGLLSRMKVYQTAVAASTTAASVLLHQMNIIPSSVLYAVVYLGVAACLPFYTIGILSNNLVGKIYLSDDKKTIQVSYLNFWGKRKDSVIEVEDILPFSEIRGKPNDVYFKIERYSSISVLKITLKFGKIENKELFVKIFGDVDTK